MDRRPPRRLLERRLAPLAAAAVLLGSGCGTSSGHSTFPQYLFTQNCAPCHSLQPGKPSPDPKAPNLATGRYSRDQIVAAVLEGRTGMPKRLLKGEWLDTAADYIVEHEQR